ncbi:hypothetical protein RN001_005683 [Aquatica leii]|uniref:Uncharacterized protein n=1 Tax=Aquatica leii TaxID=1421715 RepID=A0AAN7Q0M7_9COLE|nr:hypothetical protein RN001_005683 [Aquatica leii]
MESENESPLSPTTPRKKAQLLKAQQKYKHEWEYQYDWLTSDPVCEFNAKCKICALTFTIGQTKNLSDDDIFELLCHELPDCPEDSEADGDTSSELAIKCLADQIGMPT